MPSSYRDEEWLQTKYWDEGLTQQEIATECGVSPRTIRKYMNEFGIATRDIEGTNHPMYGTERCSKTKQKISETLSGRTMSETWRNRIAAAHEGKTIPSEVREKISNSLQGFDHSLETRQKMSESTTGEDNPNWRGGYSYRYGASWSLTREQIRKRDKTCQDCDHDGSENRLEVHHIIPVRVFRKASETDIREAHDPENLILLCNRCHGKADHGLLDLEAGVPSPSSGESRDSA